MKEVEGWYWPDGDKECHPVVPNQVQDVRKAIRYCKNTDQVIQAGGNIGMWPAQLATTFNKVWTFEPDWKNYECLKKNIGHVPNITSFNVGLGNITELAGMDRDPKNVGAHQVDFGKSPDILNVPLDAVIKTPESPSVDASIDLIVLDIEGYEPFALMGASQTIATHRPVIMLEDKGLTAKFGYPKGWSEDWAASKNYEIVERPHRDVIMVPK